MQALGGPVKPTCHWRSTQPRTFIRLASSRGCCCSPAQLHRPPSTSAFLIRGPAASKSSWSIRHHRQPVSGRTLWSCRAESGPEGVSGSNRGPDASSAAKASADPEASGEGRILNPTPGITTGGVGYAESSSDDWSPYRQLARLVGQVAADCKAAYLWLARVVTGLWAAAASAVMGAAMYFPSVAQRVKLRRLKRELEQSINPARYI